MRLGAAKKKKSRKRDWKVEIRKNKREAGKKNKKRLEKEKLARHSE